MAKPVSPTTKAVLTQVLGIEVEQRPVLSPDEVELTPSALTDADRAAFEAIVGKGNVGTAKGDRLTRAGGKSTFDLLRRTQQKQQETPDGVVLPGSEDEILKVLQYASEHGVAVVPFGGGTSVVGGVQPVRGKFASVISLDLRRLDQLVSIDEISQEATLQGGVTGPDAERLLGEHGYSLGHFPQSFPYATIGGFAATRSAGQDSAGYGRFDDMVQKVRMVTPKGIIDAGRAPGSAAGPDIKQILIGSEGVFGVITQVSVRIHKKPAVTRYEAWRFPDFKSGADAVRAVEQTGTGPTVLRLSDEAETAANLATHERDDAEPPSGCLMITLFEGTEEHTASRYRETHDLLEKLGGTSLGEKPAKLWEHGRFGAPVLRDALLAAGTITETLETATDWSNIFTLKQAVTDALVDAFGKAGSPVVVLCHISHVYPTGCSLYFTLNAAQKGQPLDEWWSAKSAAADAIEANGGTITHHHSVGTDHRPWMEREIGPLGVSILKAIKAELDPAGVMNPGKLIP